jgi:NAD(P)-dependent dehydrogenase (short-subunit alcohol dehydrogenase family)
MLYEHFDTYIARHVVTRVSRVPTSKLRIAMPNALLTGVGRRRGIAAGIAAGLAADGWDLALSYWHTYDQRVGHGSEPDDPERLADELRGQNRRILLVPGDLEDPAYQPRW